MLYKPMLAKKITQMRKLRKITEKELSAGIGMSMTGFRQAMANDDFKVSTLFGIANFLKVDVRFFFTDSYENDLKSVSVSEPMPVRVKCSSCEMKDEIIKQKEETISDLKYTINNLKTLLEQKDRIINSSV